jgi:ABC-type multidrug transport system fused ATPase/permease subunit
LPGVLRSYGALLAPRARRQFLALCTLAGVAGLLEVLAVASIMPFLAALASPEIAASEPRLARALALLGATSHLQSLAWLGGLVLAILVVSNAFSAAVTWLLLRFANRQGHALSVRLLASYLAKPYTFYLERHTAEMQKNVFAEVHRVTSGILVPAAHIVTKMSATLFLCALLLAVDPVVAVAVGAVLGGAYAVLYKVTRTTLQSAGRASVETGALRFRHGVEALAGAKEIKLLGREAEFVERFSEPSLRWADTQTKAQALSLLPRYAVETVALSLVLLLAIYLLGTGHGMGELLPLLGLYAFAGYRLMPALHQVFAGFATVRSTHAALEAVLKDLQPSQAPDAAAERLHVDAAIELAGVRYRYPGESTWALQPTTLRIPRNASIALVGSTGCGKTTVADLLMGLLRPLEGSVRVDGVEIGEANLRAWQRNIGHVPQQIFLFDDSIASNIALGLPAARIDMTRVEQAARLARLHDFAASLPAGYLTRVGDRGIRLSGGERQRIGIARALYHDPEVLVFDEATSALDNATENALLKSLQGLAGRKTLVTIAHRLSTVRHCDRIYVMEDGRIVESGTYDELARQGSRFQALTARAG